MLIATWNVNSIRTRLSQILDWINQSNPDILCLQETKVMDDSFPVKPFEKLGYSVEIYGQKSYNGVAIISKIKPENELLPLYEQYILYQALMRDALVDWQLAHYL